MSSKILVGVPMGRFQTNCYILGDREAGTCVIVDPGESAAERVPGIVDQLQLTPDAVLLTHAHVDHLWSAPDLAERYDVGVHLHEDDRFLWDGPQRSYGNLPPQALIDRYGLDWQPDSDRLVELKEWQRLTQGGVTFEVRHTPGHTPGHCTFLASGMEGAQHQVVSGAPEPTDQLLLSGDLLFAGSVGRSDLARGDGERLIAEIHRTAMKLADDVVVLPGHGQGTTVGQERRHNPFLR